MPNRGTQAEHEEKDVSILPKVGRRSLVGGIAGLASAAALPSQLKAATMAMIPDDAEKAGALHVPARVINMPGTISPEAQRYLAQGAARMGPNAPPLPA